MSSNNTHDFTASSSQASPETNQSNPIRTPDSASSDPVLHPQSCVLCAQRKVKCDRKDPTCANCVKAKVACEYRAPLPRGPRKRKHLVDQDSDSPAAVAEKLAKCEELLRSLGISPDKVSDGSAFPSPAHKQSADGGDAFSHPKGRLMAEDGRLRYVENTLFSTVADEMPEHESSMSDQQRETELARSDRRFYNNAAGSMMLGLPFLPHRLEPTSLDVPREYALVFWQYFIENVYPLTKIIHAPTEEKHHVIFLNRPQDVPKRIQALLAGIYFSALNSMNEDQCQHHFQRSWRELVQTFFPVTANALIEARFMGTIDIETLQGLVFFLITCKDKMDARTVWTLVGVAVRIGQYIGLHHDGDELGISPFQSEIRRRLWWQIGILEASIGELSGFGPSNFMITSNTKQPTNLNDSDLYPAMDKLPPPRIGATDMIFVMLRTTGGIFAKRNRLGAIFTGSWMKDNADMTKTLSKVINDLEELLEREFLRYCDLINPLHKLCSSLARVFLCRLRLKMYHPKRRKRADAGLNEQEREFCFENACKILEYDNFVLTDKSLDKFRFHIINHFQYDALLFLLHDLQTRSVFDQKSKDAWQTIEQCFVNHVEMIQDNTKLLNIAVGVMCLKAWNFKEKAQQEKSPQDPMAYHTPDFIRMLRQREADRHAQRQQPEPASKQSAGEARQAMQAPPEQSDRLDSKPMALEFDQNAASLDHALDAMVGRDFSFGVADDFNFTFDMPQDFAMGNNSAPPVVSAGMYGASNYDVWDNLFNWGQPPGGGIQ